MDNIIYFIKSTLSSDMASSGFPLIYKGEMNHQIMRSFAFMANRKIAEKNIPTPIRKKVFHVMIECLQNITKHSDDFDEKEKQIGNGLFVVGQNKDSFYVVTGNLIGNEKIKVLEDRINLLNNADKEKLKELFLKQMMEGVLTEKGGAGLGLIDIARKSGRKLFYHFVPYDNHRHFFLLVVTIPINSSEEDGGSN
ncbi:MAG TPA: SiaB family protein kinase [Tenuifilaceae bacterium]|nr:SiaB family protein kinase [Tenuifilaceae bacterium]HPE19086.1 SiaB family protein kinase [Tenuifilaceae bacterium]HPJ46595.1 SiaB family protein kinase [Tenuifilaceae bacterium]HPQ34969.1 SiaB family protein kinase [Tenuifilaceae bacterium]HRX68753.1 SiaB family protein kinase [Tenuifilaceae bacterium]